jgi:hypothetical protein
MDPFQTLRWRSSDGSPGHDDFTAEAVKLAQRGVGGGGGAHSRPEHCSSVNVVPQRPGSRTSASP